MNKTAYYLTLSVGIITCLSFFPHAFLGMQVVLDHIENGEILKPAAKGMRMIWLYSSVMMLLSGLWLLLLAKPIQTGSHKARTQVLLLGLGLTFFGLGCTYIADEIDAMFLFAVEGIVLILATTLFFQRAHH